MNSPTQQSKLKVLIVFGTRPEAIKMAPVVKAFESCANVDARICSTGQHKEMLDQAIHSLQLNVDFELAVMKRGQNLARLSSRILEGVTEVFETWRPDIVLVHGDTTTALMAAIAAYYAGIKIGHVEAGLRTYNVHSPFPEEFNRQAISKIASWHFAPTEDSGLRLSDEGIDPNSIYIVGNTVLDSLKDVLERINNDSKLKNRMREELQSALEFDFDNDRFVLITGHRRESFGDGFEQITEAIAQLAIEHPGVSFVYPVHLNPVIRDVVNSKLARISNIRLTPPLPPDQFAYLLERCLFVLTDSGGVQEEAPFLGKPVVVMRETTERPEAVNNGAAVLVGTNRQTIVKMCEELLSESNLYSQMAVRREIFGDGTAGVRIASLISATEGVVS